VGRLDRVDRPTETIQFVMMAYAGEFAGSDHVHTSGWYSARRPEGTPQRAAQMVEIGAHGVGGPSWDARSNYAYLDGHAATHPFRDVYTDASRNRFDPTLR
jgi:prepilin-type processing-associated H-X9-DG protein